MLSAAKHLLFLVENKQKQIPRFARDDIVGASFISLSGDEELHTGKTHDGLGIDVPLLVV
jgi:hypothetical protein